MAKLNCSVDGLVTTACSRPLARETAANFRLSLSRPPSAAIRRLNQHDRRPGFDQLVDLRNLVVSRPALLASARASNTFFDQVLDPLRQVGRRPHCSA